MGAPNRLLRLEQETLAVRMIRLGFRGSIVAQESGLPTFTVRQLRREVIGADRHGSSGRLPESSGIMRVRRRLVEAGLFVLVYRAVAPKSATGRPDIGAVIHAFELYGALHRNLHAGHRVNALNATDAWILARDLHIGWLQIVHCATCGTPYPTVPDQLLSQSCPFCSLSGAPPALATR